MVWCSGRSATGKRAKHGGDDRGILQYIIISGWVRQAPKILDGVMASVSSLLPRIFMA